MPNVHSARLWSGSEYGFARRLSTETTMTTTRSIQLGLLAALAVTPLSGLPAGFRDADLAPLVPWPGWTGYAAMHEHLSCSLSRLSSSEPVAIVRVSGCLPGLHPIRLYWFRTRMTDVPVFAGKRTAPAPPFIPPRQLDRSDRVMLRCMSSDVALFGKYRGPRCVMSAVGRRPEAVSGGTNRRV